MGLYIYRVAYTLTDDTVTYERQVVSADTEAEAEADVDEATERYPALVGATKTLTLLATVP